MQVIEIMIRYFTLYYIFTTLIGLVIFLIDNNTERKLTSDIPDILIHLLLVLVSSWFFIPYTVFLYIYHKLSKENV